MELVTLGNELKNPNEKKISTDNVKIAISRGDFGYLALSFRYILKAMNPKSAARESTPPVISATKMTPVLASSVQASIQPTPTIDA